MPPQVRDNRVVPTRKGAQYTPEQWAEKRSIITQLYAIEGKSLREVKELLRIRYDFRPTCVKSFLLDCDIYANDWSSDRMYQRKIAQWELDKKRKAPEMRAILRLARERQAAGQESIFRIRGRRTDIEEVYRYFRRRGEDPTRIDVRDSPIPPTITVDSPPPPRPPQPAPPQQVEIFDSNDPYELRFAILPGHNALTYPPSETDPYPASAAGSSSGSSTRSDSIVSTPVVFSGNMAACQMIPNYPSLAIPIDVTFQDRWLRYLLHQTQLFFDTVVLPEFYTEESANTVISKPWRRTLSSWSQATSEGHELMQGGQADETLARLRSKAHDSVKKHIENRSPIILLRYFEIIYTLFNSKDKRDKMYLDATLKFVLRMAGTVLRSDHPITQLTWLFLHPQASTIIGPLAYQGIQKSLQILFERCGDCHPRILYVLDSRTQTLLDEHQYEEAVRQATLYLERAKLILRDGSYESCQARRMLGDAYFAKGQLDKAVEAYTIAFEHQRHLRSLTDRGIIGVRTKRGLAGIAESQGRLHEAQEHLRYALQLAKDSFGEEDVQVKLVEKDLRALHDMARQLGVELAFQPT